MSLEFMEPKFLTPETANTSFITLSGLTAWIPVLGISSTRNKPETVSSEITLFLTTIFTRSTSRDTAELPADIWIGSVAPGPRWILVRIATVIMIQVPNWTVIWLFMQGSHVVHRTELSIHLKVDPCVPYAESYDSTLDTLDPIA